MILGIDIDSQFRFNEMLTSTRIKMVSRLSIMKALVSQRKLFAETLQKLSPTRRDIRHGSMGPSTSDAKFKSVETASNT